MLKQSYGIIAYGGLSREALLDAAKRAFAAPGVPARFESFLPLFPLELVQNMDYVGLNTRRGARVAPSGFSIDPTEYHRKLAQQLPELYAEDNRLRNFDYEGRFVGRGAFTVDRAWVERFPQYQPFLGEPLRIHLIGGGSQAVAVPYSLYPRGGGVLTAVERAMGATQRADQYALYARTRVTAGETYDADAFGTEYLSTSKLTPVAFSQNELGHVMQELSIVRGLQSGRMSTVGLYTENAKRAENLRQYVPCRYACDPFERETVGKRTARLAQLCYADADFISDLWMPWQDVTAYIDRADLTLDVARLAAGYQLAPDYDPSTLGGRYPDTLRVVVVRDRELPLLTADALNNPAYGSGMSPQGSIGRQVLLPDSRELIRQRKLAIEESTVTLTHTTLEPEAYRRCVAAAVLQEHKGRLVDAMYRREAALSQIAPDAPIYARARELLDQRVERLEAIVRREAPAGGQMSGYDADIDYLRRKRLDREGATDEDTREPIAFAVDPLRERSIESGYAMRASMIRLAYDDARLPDDEPDEADEPEDEPIEELAEEVVDEPEENEITEEEPVEEVGEEAPDEESAVEEDPVEDEAVDDEVPDEEEPIDDDEPIEDEVTEDEVTDDEEPTDEPIPEPVQTVHKPITLRELTARLPKPPASEPEEQAAPTNRMAELLKRKK